MRKRQSNTDKARLQHLRNILTHAGRTNPDGELLLDEPLIRDLTEQIPIYERAIEHKGNQLSRRIRATRNRDRQIALLENKIRAYWSVIQHRVRDGIVEPADMRLYGLGTNGKRPSPNNQREWLALGHQVTRADAEAEAEGTPRVSEPDRETIQGALDQAEQAVIEAESASLALEEARASLAAQKEEAIDLLKRIDLALRMSLRKLTPEQQRQRRRNLGFQYESDTSREGTEQQEQVTERSA